MDQGLFAMSNFALNILLARWLAPQEYGAFGAAFAIYLFVGNLHQATLIEPMLVFGPGRYRERLPQYLGALVYGHVGFAALASLALLVGGLGFALYGMHSLSTALVALALAGPFILLLWLMRRACYARLEPRLAASGGAWYMVLMLVGTGVCYRFGWLSTSTALGVMGGSSLIVSLWLMVRLRVERPPLRKGDLVQDSLNSHWTYGRWSVANKALAWVPANLFFLLVPLWGGLAAGANYKALINLLLPLAQANAALATLLLPVFVRSRENADFASLVRLSLTPLVAISGLYWLLLGIFHEPVVNLAYGGKYVEQADLLWILGLIPIIVAVSSVMSHALRALERPDWLFLAYVVSAVTTGTLGAMCVYLWGLTGAGVGLLLANGSVAVLTTALLIVFSRRSSGGLIFAKAEKEGQ